jgi:hypothetical protein
MGPDVRNGAPTLGCPPATRPQDPSGRHVAKQADAEVDAAVRYRLDYGVVARECRWVPSVDYQRAWREGIGFVGRIRGVVVQALGALGISTAIGTYLKQPHIAVSFGLAAGAWIWALYYRFGRIAARELRVGARLHDVCHHIRDEAVEVRQAVTAGVEQYRIRYEAFHNNAADRISDYFRASFRDPTINCAVRLAAEENGQRVYVTAGRSKGMNPNRRHTSKPVAADKGIAARLRSMKHQGVHDIPSIDQAVKMGWWEKCDSDDYDDVKCLLVAPINTIVGGSKHMIGILFLTARADIFRDREVEPVKAFADLLGLVYRSITLEFEFA